MLEDGTVLKFPRNKADLFDHTSLEIEHRILSAIGSHDRVIRYLGKQIHGLRFEYAENSDLYDHVMENHVGTSHEMRRKWMVQAAQAVAFVHSKGVIHSDICPHNMLLDGNLDLKICDFAGAVFGDLDGKTIEHTRFRMPRALRSKPNVATDLFALGSTLFLSSQGTNHTTS